MDNFVELFHIAYQVTVSDVNVNSRSTHKCNIDDWDETHVQELELKMCTRGSRGLAPGKL